MQILPSHLKPLTRQQKWQNELNLAAQMEAFRKAPSPIGYFLNGKLEQTDSIENIPTGGIRIVKRLRSGVRKGIFVTEVYCADEIIRNFNLQGEITEERKVKKTDLKRINN